MAASSSEMSGPGVLVRVLVKGDGCTYPQQGDACRVHYETFLEDGTRIDSSVDRDLSLQFTVGSGQVMEGWDMAILHVSLHSTVELTVPSAYAYGESGLPPQIPPHAVLVYKLELLDIER